MMNSNIFSSFLKVLIFLSMVNLCSSCNEEHANKKEKAYYCTYCAKKFPNYQGLGGHQRAHGDQIKQLFINQKIHVQNSTDVTKLDVEREGTTNNPHAMKGKSTRNLSLLILLYQVSKLNMLNAGNNYDENGPEDHNSLLESPNYFSQETNDALLVAAVQTNGTTHFSQFANHPIHIGASSNHIGQAFYASSVANHQSYANNPQFFMNGFSGSFGSNHLPCPVFYVNPENSYHNDMDQSYNRAKKQKIGGDEENLSITSPPIMLNIDSGPLVSYETGNGQKKNCFSTKDANLEDRGVSVSEEEVNNASTSNNIIDVEEQEEELDLSLHL